MVLRILLLLLLRDHQLGSWPTSWSDISPPDSVRFRKPFHGFESEWRRQSSFLAPTHSPVPRVQGLEDVSEWPCSSAASVKGRGREGAQRYPSRFKSSMRSNHSSMYECTLLNLGIAMKIKLRAKYPSGAGPLFPLLLFRASGATPPFLAIFGR